MKSSISIGERSFRIAGYASIFDEPDLNGDVVRRGAFQQSIQQKLIPNGTSSVKMLYQHTAERPIGKWLSFREDEIGLYVEGDIFKSTRDGADLAPILSQKAIDGLSIGFRPIRSRRLRGGGRELLEIELWEISIVTFPMAKGARITSVMERQARQPRNLLA